MITVKDIIFSDPKHRDSRGLVVLFSNNKYQSVMLTNSKGTPEDIADMLIELGHNILNDDDLK